MCQICEHKIPKETPVSTKGDDNKAKTSIAINLGVLEIVFAWQFAIIGHVVSIMGIIIGLKEKNETGKTTGSTISIIVEFCAVI